jgi:hypothetical protein
VADLPGQPCEEHGVRRFVLRFCMCFWCWHTTADAFSTSA